jgi:glycosyltransferase involved in cell wall biosynthesis
VITSARNESQYIGITINSMIKQSIKPDRWIIVDDGSTDDTFEIVKKASKNYSWITLIKNNSSEKRAPGANDVNAFNYAFGNLKDDYNYIVKLDADLEFDEYYFEKLIQQFEANDKLGIAGGYCLDSINTPKQDLFYTPNYHVRGATKMYRKKCFDDIGGLVPRHGWDGIDELKAMMLGWETRSIKDIIILHLRPSGKAIGLLSFAWIRGTTNYYMGYNPLYLMLCCINNFYKKPYVLFGLTLFAGYVYSYVTNSEQIDDKNLIIFIKKFQRQRIIRFLKIKK